MKVIINKINSPQMIHSEENDFNEGELTQFHIPQM